MTEEYFLITEKGSDNFTESLNEKTKEGFELEGSHQVTPYTNHEGKPAFLFTQLVAKYSELMKPLPKSKFPMFPTWEQSIYNQPKLISEIVLHGQSPLALLVQAQNAK